MDKKTENKIKKIIDDAIIFRDPYVPEQSGLWDMLRKVFTKK